MTIWYTSDTHFNHKNILNLGDGRPFDTIEEHNETIVRNFNEVMGDDDLLVHLGDVALGPWPVGLSYVSRLPGVARCLVPGNHDRVSSVEKESRRERFRADYEGVFDKIYSEVISDFVYNRNKSHFIRTLASHYPYSGESDPDREDRFVDIRPVDAGIPLIHGHTHASEKVTYSEAGTVQISVGVDAWDYYPVSEYDIYDLIKENL